MLMKVAVSGMKATRFIRKRIINNECIKRIKQTTKIKRSGSIPDLFFIYIFHGLDFLDDQCNYLRGNSFFTANEPKFFGGCSFNAYAIGFHFQYL
jgi:hypothetical protein